METIRLVCELGSALSVNRGSVPPEYPFGSQLTNRSNKKVLESKVVCRGFDIPRGPGG